MTKDNPCMTNKPKVIEAIIAVAERITQNSYSSNLATANAVVPEPGKQHKPSKKSQLHGNEKNYDEVAKK